MQRRNLLYLLVVMITVITILTIIIVHLSFGQNITRQIIGLPLEGYRLWWITAHGKHLFVVEVGQIDTQRWKPRLPLPSLFRAFYIDPTTEQVLGEIKTRHLYAQAILAGLEKRPDSWLVQDYERWLLDTKANTVYALKPVNWEEERRTYRYSHVEIIDLQTKRLKKIIELPLGTTFGTFALHPFKPKLYLSVREPDVGGLLWIYNTVTLEKIKTVELNSDLTIGDICFSKDGYYLFGSLGARGIAIIDTNEDKLVGWISPPKDRLYTVSIALSPDGKEIYVGLEYGFKKGGIVAIDIEQRKIMRILELSPTGCTSVVVVGEKLFAACLDGVYVIDIPAWRQQ